jgi:hypothetical protein
MIKILAIVVFFNVATLIKTLDVADIDQKESGVNFANILLVAFLYFQLELVFFWVKELVKSCL